MNTPLMRLRRIPMLVEKARGNQLAKGAGIKKGKVVSRQPIFIVNLKSNTMKNTLQI